MLPCVCCGQRTCGQKVSVGWSILFRGKGTCFCHTGCPKQGQIAMWVTKTSIVTCSWMQYFVDRPLEHHSALPHNMSVHQQITFCTSTAKQTIAVKRSTSANTNTSSLAAKKHPLSRFGFSYMPEFIHHQIILSCFNCVSILIGKKSMGKA